MQNWTRYGFQLYEEPTSYISDGNHIFWKVMMSLSQAAQEEGSAGRGATGQGRGAAEAGACLLGHVANRRGLTGKSCLAPASTRPSLFFSLSLFLQHTKR